MCFVWKSGACESNQPSAPQFVVMSNSSLRLHCNVEISVFPQLHRRPKGIYIITVHLKLLSPRDKTI